MKLILFANHVFQVVCNALDNYKINAHNVNPISSCLMDNAIQHVHRIGILLIQICGLVIILIVIVLAKNVQDLTLINALVVKDSCVCLEQNV
jgi:hypothetical protein